MIPSKLAQEASIKASDGGQTVSGVVSKNDGRYLHEFEENFWMHRRHQQYCFPDEYSGTECCR